MSSLAEQQRDAEVAQTEILANVIHELRQPLSNIESVAYHLTLVLPKGDQKIQAQLERIRELVQQTNEILSKSVRLSVCSQAVEPIEGG